MTNSRSRRSDFDAQVGARLRLARQLRKMSQTALGDELGVTFQQVQKYELGTNRLSVSAAVRAARALEISPMFFLTDGATEGAGSDPSADGAEIEALQGDRIEVLPEEVVEALVHDSGTKLIRAFLRIEDPGVRKKLIELAETVASRPRR